MDETLGKLLKNRKQMRSDYQRKSGGTGKTSIKHTQLKTSKANEMPTTQ
jgi:hypothetical protein